MNVPLMPPHPQCSSTQKQRLHGRQLHQRKAARSVALKWETPTDHLLMDRQGSQHFVDHALFAGFEQDVLNYTVLTVLNPLVRFHTAGGVWHGVGKGVLPVLATDHLRRYQMFTMEVELVPGMGCHAHYRSGDQRHGAKGDWMYRDCGDGYDRCYSYNGNGKHDACHEGGDYAYSISYSDIEFSENGGERHRQWRLLLQQLQQGRLEQRPPQLRKHLLQ